MVSEWFVKILVKLKTTNQLALFVKADEHGVWPNFPEESMSLFALVGRLDYSLILILAFDYYLVRQLHFVIVFTVDFIQIRPKFFVLDIYHWYGVLHSIPVFLEEINRHWTHLEPYLPFVAVEKW